MTHIDSKKICLLFCYFGKFDWDFRFFLKSCEYNPSIHFYIITDQKVEYNVPKNIIFISKTLEDVNVLATQKLNIKTQINYAYKICDFKPAYGVIFNNIIKGYDFWGSGDVDTIFGNIREFIDDNMLSTYDIISSRIDHLAGCFFLFRNNAYINRLYEQSKDYKKVFSSSIHYCFDECNFAFEKLKRGEDILNIDSEIESMTHVVKKLEKKKSIKIFFDDLGITDIDGGGTEWNEGKLYYKDQYEILFYNLSLFKANHFMEIPEWEHIPSKYYIHRFYFSLLPLDTKEGKMEYAKKIGKSQKKMQEKILSYNNKSPLKLKDSEIEYFKPFEGTYKYKNPPEEYEYFYMKIKISSGNVQAVFPNRILLEKEMIYTLLYYGQKILILNTPFANAEVSFEYSERYGVEQLILFLFEDSSKMELYKLLT